MVDVADAGFDTVDEATVTGLCFPRMSLGSRMSCLANFLGRMSISHEFLCSSVRLIVPVHSIMIGITSVPSDSPPRHGRQQEHHSCWHVVAPAYRVVWPAAGHGQGVKSLSLYRLDV